MNTNACYCGRAAHAYCTRCGAALCFMHHHDREHRSAWLYRNWGQGKTLAEAAHVRGYWSAREGIVCKNCRRNDGEQHRSAIVQQSHEWLQDSFRFALTAASLGYVITEPGMAYAEVVQSWLNLKWQPTETITLSRLVRPEKSKRRGGRSVVTRQAEYARSSFPGWVFPRTVLQSLGHSTPQEDDPQRWIGVTKILTDGRVFQAGNLATQPLTGVTHRLIVEMARKMAIARGKEWKGPEENWD